MCIQMGGYHVDLHVCVHIYMCVNPKKFCENMQVPTVESGGILSQPGPWDSLLQSFLFSTPSPHLFRLLSLLIAFWGASLLKT